MTEQPLEKAHTGGDAHFTHPTVKTQLTANQLAQTLGGFPAVSSGITDPVKAQQPAVNINTNQANSVPADAKTE